MSYFPKHPSIHPNMFCSSHPFFTVFVDIFPFCIHHRHRSSKLIEMTLNISADDFSCQIANKSDFKSHSKKSNNKKILKKPISNYQKVKHFSV